ncbi:hypothetical protein [Streptomyces sp. Y1]|uniref:Integral membrane protein n=1 Tax=Streptomyces sp. Y1 TaxID=3238634 RepID=A0AB39TFP8_9ACTN
MVDGDTNQMSGNAPEAAEDGGGAPELSRPAAVVATVLAAVCGAAVVLAFVSWLGWSVPLVGVLVAKGGIKLAVGGFAGLAAAFAWLRTRLRAPKRTD